MKVKNCYNIDEDELCNKSEESEYWDKCFRFYVGIKKTDVANLSISQKDWLNNIEDKLDGQ